MSLQMFQEQSSHQLEKLNEENTALRNRLRDVAYSPLSDNEKQELLQRHHNSAPASIATNVSNFRVCVCVCVIFLMYKNDLTFAVFDSCWRTVLVVIWRLVQHRIGINSPVGMWVRFRWLVFKIRSIRCKKPTIGECFFNICVN